MENIKQPSLYNIVFFHEENVSDLFLIKILDVILSKNESDAREILKNLKKNGRENVGKFTKEIAETKRAQIVYNAEANNFSFICELELAE